MLIRKSLLAGTTALALLIASPTPGFCDIGPGDLGDAADHIADSIVAAIVDLGDFLCSILVQPIEVPTVQPPVPPDTMIGGQPDSMPDAPDTGIAATEELIEDQQQRATSAEAAVEQAAEASAGTAAHMQALGALNITPPVSVAAGQQIGNEIAIASSQAVTTGVQLQATSVAMQADEIVQREHAREVELEQMRSFSNYGQPIRIRAETIKLAR